MGQINCQIHGGQWSLASAVLASWDAHRMVPSCVSFLSIDLCNSHEIKFCKPDLLSVAIVVQALLTDVCCDIA